MKSMILMEMAGQYWAKGIPASGLGFVACRSSNWNIEVYLEHPSGDEIFGNGDALTMSTPLPPVAFMISADQSVFASL